MSEENLNPVNENPNLEVETPVVEEPKKKSFFKSFKFISSIIGLIALIGAVLWFLNMFDTYKKANVYKEAYVTVNQQKDFRRDALTKEVKVEIVDYCREFTKRFEKVDNTQEK